MATSRVDTYRRRVTPFFVFPPCPGVVEHFCGIYDTPLDAMRWNDDDDDDYGVGDENGIFHRQNHSSTTIPNRRLTRVGEPVTFPRQMLGKDDLTGIVFRIRAIVSPQDTPWSDSLVSVR